jgi:hypothetical protein
MRSQLKILIRGLYRALQLLPDLGASVVGVFSCFHRVEDCEE